MRWKLRTIAILGILVAILPFLGFTLFMYKAILLLSGIGVAFLSCWIISEKKLKN